MKEIGMKEKKKDKLDIDGNLIKIRGMMEKTNKLDVEGNSTKERGMREKKIN